MNGKPLLGLTKVIILDEKALFREGLRRLLSDQGGFECVGTAADGASALKLVADLRPDVVVMDVVLPDLAPAQVIGRIKQEYPSVSLVILTDCKRFQQVAEAVTAGADAYLSKAMSEVDLISAIHLARRGLSLFDYSVIGDAIRQAMSKAAKRGLAFGKLTKREFEVLRLATQGMSDRQIGETLGISPHTASKHIGNLFRKMSVDRRSEAGHVALEKGWLEIDDIHSR